MRRLEFSIAVKAFGDAAKKDAKKLTDELKAQDTAVTRLAKNTNKLLDANRFAFRGVEDSARRATDAIKGGFEKAASAIERVNDRLKEKTKETFRSIGQQFKLAFAVFSGEHLIEKAFELPRHLMEAGRSDINARMRARREFGGDAGFMDETAKRVARNAGLDDAAAMNALFSIGEAVSGTQAGTAFRGKKLTGAGADALRKNTFNFGAGLLERVLTVTHAQGDEATGIAQALSNAGTGPEGMRSLVSMLHLNRAFSAEALKANEKGKLADLIGPDMARQFGVQKGKIAGQGTLIDILLTKSGITEGAAKEERSKFDFQIKSIGASFESILGEIGSKALDRVDNGFAKGTTLAEKFQRIIESPKGRETIDKIADGLAKGAEGAISLATNIPKAFGWLESHKGVIELALGAYAGLSILGKVRGGGGHGVLGAAGSLLGATKPIPVYVVNGPGSIPGDKKAALKAAAAGGVGSGLLLAAAGAAAAYGGYKAGNYLGKHVGAIGKGHDALANGLYALTGEGVADKKLENFEVGRFEKMLMQKNADRSALIKQLESGGISHGRAVYLSEHRNEIPPIDVHTHLYIDGKQVAESVNKHNANKIKNATAGIPQ